jgi:hypothetical protein
MLILYIKWHQRCTQLHFKNLKYWKQPRESNTPCASVCVCANPRFNFWNSWSTFNKFSVTRSALFRDITRRGVAISHRSFRTNYLSHVQGSKVQAEGLLDPRSGYQQVPKRRCEITTPRCVMSHMSAELIYIAVEVWSHAFNVNLFPKLVTQTSYSKAHSIGLWRCCMTHWQRLDLTGPTD